MSRVWRKGVFHKGTPKFLRMPARRKARRQRRQRWQPDPVRQLLARVQPKE
jgi:hypothetical protein